MCSPRPRTRRGLVTATGTAHPITLGDRFAETVNLLNYANLVSGSDWTAAFNALSAVIRGAIQNYGAGSDSNQAYADKAIVIPPSIYELSSWDLTNIRAQGWDIIAYGAPHLVALGGDELMASFWCTQSGDTHARFCRLRVE